MPDRRYPALDRLIRQATQVSNSKPDPVQMLAYMIRVLGDSGGDPYLILGVLMEGAAHTLATHVPPERQAETRQELVQLLAERLAAHGLPEP